MRYFIDKLHTEVSDFSQAVVRSSIVRELVVGVFLLTAPEGSVNAAYASCFFCGLDAVD